ncbi:MAG: tetratricopeptide repeat protein [Methylococcales bacterium]
MKLYKILILAFFTTALIACGGAEERKAVYMEKAKASIDAGDLDKARIELKNVLQIDPKDGEAYYQLGKVYEQLKDIRKAYANYRKAEGLAPDLLVNQASLGSIYLYITNEIDKAKEKSDLILSKDPGNSAGLLLKAAILVRAENDRESAKKIIETIVSREPENVPAVAFLSALYMGSGEGGKAIEILKASLKLNINNKKLNNLLGLIYVKNKDYEQAEAIYKQLLELEPDSRQSYKSLAAFYNASDNKVQAEKVLRDSVANDPEDADRYFDLLKYISVVKGNEESLNELKAFVAQDDHIGKLRIALGEFLYINNKKDEAIDVYKAIIQDFSDEKVGVDARIALATIYMSRKEIEKAKKVIDAALLVSSNDPKVNMLAARLALHEKNSEQAIIALRIVNKETPENIDAYLLLSNAYKLAGNNEQANKVLNSAYENNKSNPDSLLTLAKWYLSRNIDLAERIIDDYINLKKSDYTGLSLKAAILNKKKKYSEAYEIAKKLMAEYPDKANGYLQAVPYFENDKEKIVSILEKGYSTAKDNRDILMLLSSMQVSEKKFDVVEKRIMAELEKSPDDAVLITLLAKVYLFDNNPEPAISLLKKLVESKATLEDPYLLLTKIYSQQKNVNAATEILEKGVENVASSLKISLRLVMIYEFNDEYQKAISVYQKLYDLYPDNLLVVNNLVSLLLDHSENKIDFEMVSPMVAKLKESGDKVFLDTIGWMYYKAGDYNTALDTLNKAVEKSPDVNILNYHLGMTYKMSGDKNQAKIYLEKSLADGKKFKEKELAKAALKGL